MHSTALPPLQPISVSMTPLWLKAARLSVAAGFPSPAEDHQVERIELMAQLVKHPQATFYVRIQGDTTEQLSLTLGYEELKPRTLLMTTLDEINKRFGRETLHLASTGTAGKARTWEMKQERKTPGYTTDWSGIPTAN